MLYDALLTEEEKALRDEVRQFVRDEVPADLLRAMDRDEIKFPYEFIAKLAEHSLRGIRFPKKWGGRELPWTAEVVAEEEVGVLGVALGCAFVMSSIVGEALNVFGTDEQKERYLRPIITGTKIPEEALTEPRGGSDFFGATTRAVADGDSFILNGQKRFVAEPKRQISSRFTVTRTPKHLFISGSPCLSWRKVRESRWNMYTASWDAGALAWEGWSSGTVVYPRRTWLESWDMVLCFSTG